MNWLTSHQSWVQREVLPHSCQITWGKPLASAGRDVRTETMEPLEWISSAWLRTDTEIHPEPFAFGRPLQWALSLIKSSPDLLLHSAALPQQTRLGSLPCLGVPVLFGLPKVFSLQWFTLPHPLSPPSCFSPQPLSHVTLITEAIPEKLYRVTGM